MKDRANDRVSPGDVIMADDLNTVANLLNGKVKSPAGTRQGGHANESFSGTYSDLAPVVMRVLAIVDIVPEAWIVAEEVNLLDQFNAVKVIWDDEESAYVACEGMDVTVVSSYEVIVEGSMFLVVLDRKNGFYVPVSAPTDGFVEILSTSKNVDGYYDGNLQRWDNDNERWERIRAVHVLDGNDPAFPTVDPP